MNETEIFNFIFKFSAEDAGLTQEFAELLVMNEKLKLQVNETNAAQRKATQERKSAAEEAKAAAIAEINSLLGVQNAIKGEIGLIEKQRNELKLLKSAREQANNIADIQKYNTAIKAGQENLNLLTGATDKFKGSNGFWREMSGYIAAAFATQQLYAWGEALVSNEVKLESKRLALKNVLATQEEYIQSLTFLDKISNKYGQDITVLTDTYKNFIAASQSSGLELKERNRIYESIVKSGSALSLSNEEIEGSLRAVSQMFSKGNVQAEELRGQLGERLPGAFGLAAKALGVTEAKLNDMLKAGEVLAVDLLPKLATELEKAFGDKAVNNVNLVTGAWNRLTNSVKEWFGEINKSYGITSTIAKGFNLLADNLGLVVEVAITAVETFVAYQVVTRASAIATTLLTGAQKALAVATEIVSTTYKVLTGEITLNSIAQKVSLVIEGERILIKRALTATNVALTESEVAATTAARAFNASLGIVTLVIGAAVIAYQLQ